MKETKTLVMMVKLYCRLKHGKGRLCGECRELLDYSKKRLEDCKFGETKKACRKCPVRVMPLKNEIGSKLS